MPTLPDQPAGVLPFDIPTYETPYGTTWEPEEKVAATGYGNKSLEDLLEIVENQDYLATEGFWIAKELRERFLEVGSMNWQYDRKNKKWVKV